MSWFTLSAGTKSSFFSIALVRLIFTQFTRKFFELVVLLFDLVTKLFLRFLKIFPSFLDLFTHFGAILIGSFLHLLDEFHLLGFVFPCLGAKVLDQLFDNFLFGPFD